MSKLFSGLMKIIRFLSDKKVPVGKKLLFFVPILYLLFPFDLIPDLLPFAGQLDDIAVFVLMWPLLKSLLDNYHYGTGHKGDSKKKYKEAIDIEKDDYNIK